MSVYKKIMAVLLSAAAVICMLCVPAGAASIVKNAKTIKSGKTYLVDLKYSYDTSNYKIKVKKAGQLVLSITSELAETDVTVLDSKGKKVAASDHSASYGAIRRAASGVAECEWKSGVKKFTGTLTYKVKKGTYYICFERYGSQGGSSISFNVKFPSSSGSSSSSSSGKSKVVRMCIDLKLGSSMQLYGWGEFYDDAVWTWTSSDSSIVSVSSKGVIKAKKKGHATITVKVDNTKADIEIDVV